RDFVEIAVHAAAECDLRDEIAFRYGASEHLRVERRTRTRDQQVDAWIDHGAVRIGQRDLLADDRREVSVEREHVLLEVAARLRIGNADARAEQVVAEHDRAQEAIDGVDDAVVRQTEAADLVAEVAALVDVEEARVREAEHADLGVDVPQVRNLEDLRDAFEARAAVR